MPHRVPGPESWSPLPCPSFIPRLTPSVLRCQWPHTVHFAPKGTLQVLIMKALRTASCCLSTAETFSVPLPWATSYRSHPTVPAGDSTAKRIKATEATKLRPPSLPTPRLLLQSLGKQRSAVRWWWSSVWFGFNRKQTQRATNQSQSK